MFTGGEWNCKSGPASWKNLSHPRSVLTASFLFNQCICLFHLLSVPFFLNLHQISGASCAQERVSIQQRTRQPRDLSKSLEHYVKAVKRLFQRLSIPDIIFLVCSILFTRMFLEALTRTGPRDWKPHRNRLDTESAIRNFSTCFVPVSAIPTEHRTVWASSAVRIHVKSARG